LLSAVMCFEDIQMPELFAGLSKSDFAVPVPYRMANVPQAWAAGSVMQMVRILLGLEPDLPDRRIYLDPALPAWCSRLELRRLHLGNRQVRISVERKPDGQHAVDADAEGLEIVQGVPPWQELAD
jgi:glycogen debranching enzyme